MKRKQKQQFELALPFVFKSIYISPLFEANQTNEPLNLVLTRELVFGLLSPRLRLQFRLKFANFVSLPTPMRSGQNHLKRH